MSVKLGMMRINARIPYVQPVVFPVVVLRHDITPQSCLLCYHYPRVSLELTEA